MAGEPLTLTRLERASGYIVDTVRDAPALPEPAPGRARDALADAIREALEHPPCSVSFSGGRDSSGVLALATHVARSEGLDPPIPITLRFGGAARTDESDWQERIVAHLGLTDWERIELTTEVDLLGDLAQAFITTHGLHWPPNAHVHAPVFTRARGGTVLTGLDGDDLFGWAWGATRAALQRPGPVSPRAVLRAGLACAPYRVRLARKRRTAPRLTTWLRPDPQERMEASIADWFAAEPRRWDRHVARFARLRGHVCAVESLDLLAADHGVRTRHPLLDRRFLATLAAEGGRAGYGNRGATLRALFGDLLPVDVLYRRGKAEFSSVLWGPRTRAFAAQWDGRGLDDELVDVDALRREWAREAPLFGSALLLHDAWLAARSA